MPNKVVSNLAPVILMSALLMHGCAGGGKSTAESPTAESSSMVLARMGTVSLDRDEFRDLLQDLTPEARRRLKETPALAEKLLGDELVRKYLLEESSRSGWSQRPEVMRKSRRSADQAVINSFVTSRAKLSPGFPDDSLVRRTYEKNRKSLRQADQVRISQIFVEDVSEAGQDRIKRIYVLLAENPADFARLAKQYSQDSASAASGGDMGWQRRDRLPTLFAQVLDRMQPGDISSPIQSRDGLHIVQLTERKPGKPMTLEEARPYIVNQLRVDETRKLEQDYLRKQVEQNPPRVEQANLETFLQTTR